ncbi:MAG: GtrA family protein, partial [Thermodesulfobacteriota bacterium]
MKKRDLVISYVLGWIIATFVYVIRFSLREEIPGQFILIFNKFIIFIFIPVLATTSIYFAFKIGKNLPVLKQFAKFVLVGFSNLTIDFGILNILIYLFDRDQGIYYSAFKAFSFACTIVNSYLWNKFWTFENRDMSEAGKQFIKFIIVASVGLLINVVIASMVVNYISVDSISSRIWANVG